MIQKAHNQSPSLSLTTFLVRVREAGSRHRGEQYWRHERYPKQAPCLQAWMSSCGFLPGRVPWSFQVEEMAKRLNALTDGLQTFEGGGCVCVGTCLQVLHFLEPRSQLGKGNVCIRLTFLHGPRRTIWKLIRQRPSGSNARARCLWRGLARHWCTRGYARSDLRARKYTNV